MGIEQRKGRPYLYRRWRVNGRVRCEYLGPLSPAEVTYFQGRADSDRAMRTAERAERNDDSQRIDAALAAGADFDRLADRVFRAVMHLTGHTLHKRGEWRQQRGAKPVATIREVGQPAPCGNPGRAAVAPVSPEVRDLLDRAGSGQRGVITALHQLLNDPVTLDALGFAAAIARATLISLTAHDGTEVAAELVANCEQQAAQLLADGGPDPTFAERLAAARVVNNWLAVHTLEASAGRGADAAAVERRLTQAERRLHAALKSLAVLRRLRKPLTVTQVSIAKGGPLVVNNGTPGGKP